VTVPTSPQVGLAWQTRPVTEPRIVRGYYLVPGIGHPECRAEAERFARRGEYSMLHAHAHEHDCNERCEVVGPMPHPWEAPGSR
jgi:hypothetical protein